MNKIKIPNGYRVVRNGTRIHKGDLFKKENGRWSRTSDAGRHVEHGGIPCVLGQEQYAGIYIRRIKRRTAK